MYNVFVIMSVWSSPKVLFNSVIVTTIIILHRSKKPINFYHYYYNKLVLSIKWLSNQYRLALPTDEASLCAISGITCTVENGEKHFTSITLQSTNIANQPLPTATVLDFPELTHLSLSCGMGLGDAATALSPITGLDKLKKILITCYAITSIPPSFPGALQSLTELNLYSFGTTNIPVTVFQNTKAQSMRLISFNNLVSINFPTDGQLSLKYLELSLPLNQPTISFNLPSTSFKQIDALYLQMGDANYDIQIDCKVGQLNLRGPQSLINSLNVPGVSNIMRWETKVSPNYSITPNMIPNVEHLVMGPLTSTDPLTPTITLNVLAPISELAIFNSNLVVSSIPSSLSALQFTQPVNDNPIGIAGFDTYSNISRLTFDTVKQVLPLPKNIQTFAMANPPLAITSLPPASDFERPIQQFWIRNSTFITGTIPSYQFSSLTFPQLILMELPALVGSVPELFCSTLYSLVISDTGISKVPECFKCKWVDTTPRFRSVLSTPVINSITPSSYCGQTFDSTTPFIFVNEVSQVVKLTGSALGYAYKPTSGNTVSTALEMKVPNTLFEYTITQAQLINRNETISFGTLNQFNGLNPKLVTYPITWKLFYTTKTSFSKLPNALGVVMEGYFDVGQPTITVESIECTVTSFSINSISTTCPIIPNTNILNFNLTAPVLNNVSSLFSTPFVISPISQFFISSIQYNQKIGDTQIAINGQFGTNNIYHVILNPTTANPITCNLLVNTTTSIICSTNSRLSDLNEYFVQVTADGIPSWTPTPQNISFIFKQSYPYINSIPFTNVGNATKVSIYGQFGTKLFNVSVLIDNVNCPILSVNSSFIECEINMTTSGVKPILVSVDNWIYSRNDIMVFVAAPATPGDPSPSCQCTSHGTCLSNGQCQCFDDYSGPLCQFPPFINGGNMTNNETDPSVEFQGGKFSFNLVSIREIGMDGSTIIQEMNQFNWIYSNLTVDNVDLFIYKHNISTNSNSSILEMEAVIQQSKSSRTVTFAGITTTLAANSIKLTINITNWPYVSTLNSLVAVFSSDIGDVNDCFGNKINATVMSDIDIQSVKYLQIVKDNVIFYGSFLDRVLSDGRVAYSRNQLLSMDDSQQEGKVLIGISLPYCKEFLPVDESGSTTCSSSKSSDTWKIITGSVIGGAVLITLIIATTRLLLKKSTIVYQSNQVYSQTISTSECLPTDEASLCATGGITCTVSNGEKHFTSIMLTSSVNANQPLPIPKILDFPQLTLLSLTCMATTVLGDAPTALSPLIGLNKITEIHIDCRPITIIPASFPGNLPSLTSLTLLNLAATNIPVTVFQNTKVQILKLTGFNSLVSINLPTDGQLSLQYLYLSLPVLNQPTISFNMLSNNFKNITILYLYLGDAIYDIQIYAKVENLNLLGPESLINSLFLPGVTNIMQWQSKVPPNLNITPNILPNWGRLNIGPVTSADVITTTITLSVTAPIYELSISNSNLVLTSLPTTVNTFYLSYPANDNPIDVAGFDTYSNITTLAFDSVKQVLPLPKNIQSYSIRNPSLAITSLPPVTDFNLPIYQFWFRDTTSISGTIPSYNFGSKVGVPKLVLNNLPALVSPIPELFCSTVYDLDITDTGISKVPECFKCKWVNTTPRFRSVLSAHAINSITPSSYCGQTFDSTTPFTFVNQVAQVVKLTGSALGYAYKPTSGNTVSTALEMKVPNTLFEYTITQAQLINRNAMVNFGTLNQFNGLNPKLISYQINWNLFYTIKTSFSQLPNALGVVMEGYFDVGQPTITVESVECIVTSFAVNSITSTCPIIPNTNILNFNLTAPGGNNVISSYIASFVSPISQFYILSIQFDQKIGDTQIIIDGQFGTSNIYHVLLNPRAGQSIPCNIQSNTTSSIICSTNSRLSDLNEYFVQVTADGIPSWIPTPQNISFIFKQSYPYINSIPITTIGNATKVSIYGQFGTILSNVSVLIDNVNCPILSANTSFIGCEITMTTAGVKPILVSVDNWIYSRNDIMVFVAAPATPGNPSPSCQCTSHGTCLSNGQCQCFDDYSGPLCQFPPLINGGNMTNNETDPSVEFQGGKFSFNLVSIREIGMDGSTIIQEMNQFNWIYSNLTVDNVDLFIYKHNISTNSNSSILEMEAVIQQSKSSRTVTFAGITTTLAANSIKLTINITNWPYVSTLNSLVAVFSSDIGDVNDCFGNKINATVMSEIDIQSVKYLQIVKDNVIFYGSFLDRVLSDGRVAYSRNQLLSMDDNQEGKVLIGISLPYCKECIIDPDFSLVLPVDESGSTTCSSSKSSDTWKIITGSVIGGAVLITLIIATTRLLLKKSTSLKVFKMKLFK
ncbi:Tenascin [Cavenderia fasciculata]|uniref:Tenascin n=1 Tax=Cavenderia fasciculata TaxID=261658 RepID=F4QC75_CACFS|nr:Tenascin [Cavenderia fasciculata]EGG14356.1 Tenascin [Cavenderia fasciculata]|eukprot:XP_004351076.1 Tenascin [Cavenderia fasciculata]